MSVTYLQERAVNLTNSCRMGVLAYRGTYNLGDAIQTYALCRLLPDPFAAVFRDRMRDLEKKPLTVRQWVINGYLSNPIARDVGNVLFAGVYVSGNVKEQCEALEGCKTPIGARDPYTQTVLREHGVPSEMVGCATLTLPPYTGPRKGILYVDDDQHDQLTQEIRWDTSWSTQWRMAGERLELLKKAELVVTSRLHVALPCLAFGTPVVVPWKTLRKVVNPERLALLDAIGFEYGKEVVMNVRPFAEKFRVFLSANLELPLNAAEAELTVDRCPMPVTQ